MTPAQRDRIVRAAMAWRLAFQFASYDSDPSGRLFRAEVALDKACAAAKKGKKRG